MVTRVLATTLLVVGATVLAVAGEADVIAVDVRQSAPETFSFEVTVRHDDQGWQHYANRWDVVGPDGSVLGSRKLLHPHDTEQPFTRGLSGVRIPRTIAQVSVRAHDTQHGLGGKVVTIQVPHSD